MGLTVDSVIKGIANGDHTSFNDWKSAYGVDVYTQTGVTLLTWALRKKQSLNTVSFILKNGANVNRTENGGATPLLIAIHLNLFDLVKCLLKNGADITAKDSYNTPLTAAVKEGHLQIVELLLESGANVSQCDLNGVPPFIRAIKNNKLEIVDLFLKYKKGLDVVDDTKSTPLIAAITNNSNIEIIQHLLEFKVNVDESKNGKPPLGWAAESGNLEAVKLLLSNGADINLLGFDGNTALATAILWQKSEIAEYLVDNNANVCKAGENGKTPLLWAILSEDIDMMKLLLDHGAEYIIHKVLPDAVETKNLDVVRYLMERRLPSNAPQRSNTETTPLEKAIEVRSIEIAKYFIENEANVVEDLHHQEVTHILQLLVEGNIEMVKLLIENGARINELGDCGDTLLSKSIKMENFEMVKYFATQGADVNQANREGFTPLAIAESNDDFKMFQYLVECGATVSEEDQEKNSNVVIYYHMAKENISRKETQIHGIKTSNQESA